MARWILVAAIIVLLVLAVAGCERRTPATGFRLPEGNIESGQTTFVDLKCHSCHRIEGLTLPSPEVEPPVKLGGKVILPPTNGELVRDITVPSSHFALGYPRDQIQTEEGRSRMPDYGRQMSVRQLTDLVAFLQSRYDIDYVALK